ncbi:hypothetical protein TEA_009602 [Camellia sinensis var. sinensis]|uniref:Ionotropic glutamate receptor L-glutamate and glycine-binding domain-containing protein n=1 Tax=Camellia sinensis var. sinensis TaxID=542762 RepID=A0A4S4E277_CAMSN|nr:hypothetical protein TEA_009602 [Camellia sinensis var. sinensis]
MEIDPRTNATIFGGFCIDIFRSVISALPYAVPYEFVPFEIADGSSSLSYNDMVYQISLEENYDGAMGDITITANRSFYVDFTLPFAGGVSMIVPITYEDINSGEKECDKLVKNGFDDYGCEWDTCVDLCEDSFEDYRDVQVLTSTCLSDSHNCICHIRSKMMCDDDHLLFPPPLSPSPSPSLDNNGNGGGGGGGGRDRDGGGLNFRLK